MNSISDEMNWVAKLFICCSRDYSWLNLTIKFTVTVDNSKEWPQTSPLFLFIQIANGDNRRPSEKSTENR